MGADIRIVSDKLNYSDKGPEEIFVSAGIESFNILSNFRQLHEVHDGFRVL
jgi:hypothetical protein